MARPYWSGQIQISLVSFGVSLYTAIESKSQITFHQISRSTGERIRHQKVLESAAEGGEPSSAVGEDEIVKGYEYSKGQYVIIEPSELENLRIPSKHTIEVSQFIGRDELNPEYIEKPYFVMPQNDLQTEAFATVREALVKTKKVAIGKIAFSGRENLVAIMPAGDEQGRGLMAFTLRFAPELRNAAEYFREIKPATISEDSLELAEALIAKRSSKFDINKFQDGYENAVKELVDAKLKHLPLPVDEAPAPRPSNVINLMDALRKSVGEVAAGAKTAAKKPPMSEKEPPKKGIGIVKPAGAKAAAKAPAKRKSA